MTFLLYSNLLIIEKRLEMESVYQHKENVFWQPIVSKDINQINIFRNWIFVDKGAYLFVFKNQTDSLNRYYAYINFEPLRMQIGIGMENRPSIRTRGNHFLFMQQYV